MRKKLTLAYLILFILTTAGCSSFFLYPSRVMLESPAVKLFEHRDVVFQASDGMVLHGWYFPAKNPRGSILVLHGNAQNISAHANNVLWLVLEGFNVFIIDYRGYGWSGGERSLAGAHLDADAALDKLFSLPETDPNRVAVLGQSIGGAIAVYTVSHSRHKNRIRALVIDSAFSSYRKIAREKLARFWLTWPLQIPLSWTITDHYSAEKWIPQIAPVPLLILHGINDPVVPTHHGKILFEAAKEPKDIFLTSTPGHIRSFSDAEVRHKVSRFLNQTFEPSRKDSAI